jgi:hypothetical protein
MQAKVAKVYDSEGVQMLVAALIIG